MRLIIIKGIFLVILPLVLQGCVAPMSYEAAIPEIPQGIDADTHKNIIEINLPEFKLMAQIQAFDWDGEYLPPPLAVWMDINPLKGPVSLDTTQVKLKSDDDDAITAISYLGPDKKWFSPRAFAAGCGPRYYKTGIGISRLAISQTSVIEVNEYSNNAGIYRPTETPVVIESDSCFMFWFDTDSLPDHKFVLSIGNLMQNGQEIPVPDIYFKKGKVTDWKGFP